MGNKKRCNVLKPMSSKIPVYKIYGFDVETTGSKNKFLMGSIVGDNGFKKVFWDKQEMCDYIVNEPKFYKQAILFATNLGFDILALFAGTKYFDQLEPLLRGSSFICAKYRPFPDDKKRKFKHILFLDTINFAPMGVKKMGQVLGLPKLTTPAYILEEREPKKSEYAEVEKYNIRDSDITYQFATWMQDEFNREGAKMRLTVASTAMDLFKRQYLHDVWYQEPTWVMEKLYNAYYGGRTEVLKRGYATDLNYYDFNSLYPSVMTEEFPNANYQRWLKKGNMDIIETYDGVTKVEVEAPDIPIPFLPYRSENKLIFPTGRFTGYYTNVEIRKAIEIGYKIKWIGETIYYTHKHRPFEKYVIDQYSKRLKLKEANNPAQIINKLFMNSLYGKFAQKIHGKEQIFHMNRLTMQQIKEMMQKGKVTVINDFAYFTEDEPSYIPHHIFPIYSVYVTAYGRIKLWNIATQCDPYYMDTDSIITKKEIPDSMELGALKLEFKIKEGIFVKPKMYAFVDDTGDSHVKVKGLPPSKRWSFTEFKRFLKNPVTKYTKFTKFKESNKRGFAYNEIIDVEKALSLEDEKRQWVDKFNPETIQSSIPLIITR